jgi:hypothetical protein
MARLDDESFIYLKEHYEKHPDNKWCKIKITEKGFEAYNVSAIPKESMLFIFLSKFKNREIFAVIEYYHKKVVISNATFPTLNKTYSLNKLFTEPNMFLVIKTYKNPIQKEIEQLELFL